MNIKKLGGVPESYKLNAVNGAKPAVGRKPVSAKTNQDTIEFAKNSPMKSFSAELTDAKNKVAQSIKQEATPDVVNSFRQRIAAGQYHVASIAIVDRMFSL